MAGPNEVDRVVQWFSYFDRDGLRSLFPGLGWSEGDLQRTVATQSAALATVAGLMPNVKIWQVRCRSMTVS